MSHVAVENVHGLEQQVSHDSLMCVAVFVVETC